MKAVKIILIVLGCLLFAASITFNLIFGLSSTNKLIFGDNLDARITLFSNAATALDEDNLKNFTIFRETEEMSGDSLVKYKSTYSCETKKDVATKCARIAEKFVDSKLVATYYYPGDGKVYTDTSSESSFATDNTSSTYLSIAVESIKLVHLPELLVDLDVWNKTQAQLYFDAPELKPTKTIESSVKFDFKSFSLIKEVEITNNTPKKNYKTGEITTESIVVKLKFDSKDRVIEYSNESEGCKTTISYSPTTLYFPDLNNFVSKERD